MAREKRVALTNKPPRNAADRIREWSAGGSSVKAIARSLGVSLETLNVWMERHPKLRDAMDAGRDEEHTLLRDALIRQLDKGPVAAIFLLKARHGYREGDQSETANRVSINFTLPAAIPLAQFTQGKVIEHDSADD